MGEPRVQASSSLCRASTNTGLFSALFFGLYRSLQKSLPQKVPPSGQCPFKGRVLLSKIILCLSTDWVSRITSTYFHFYFALLSLKLVIAFTLFIASINFHFHFSRYLCGQSHISKVNIFLMNYWMSNINSLSLCIAFTFTLTSLCCKVYVLRKRGWFIEFRSIVEN